MTRFLQLSAALCLLAIGGAAWMVGTEAASLLHAWSTAPAQIVAAVNALPSQILPPVLASVDAAVSDADSRVKQVADLADTRTGEALGIVKAAALASDARLQSIQEQTERTTNGIRADLKPVLVGATALEAQSAALVKDAQDSLDDVYWDGKALIESATVATTSVAQSAQAVRDAAPQLSANAVSVGHSAEGIADAARREADELTKPQTARQKIFAWLGIIPRIVKVVL